MHKVAKQSHSEVPSASEPYVVVEQHGELFSGRDDVIVRHRDVTAPHRTLGQPVQL